MLLDVLHIWHRSIFLRMDMVVRWIYGLLVSCFSISLFMSILLSLKVVIKLLLRMSLTLNVEMVLDLIKK